MVLLPIVIAALCLIPISSVCGVWECDSEDIQLNQCTCYKDLVDKLLGNDRNQYNLQQAFFPPNKANPVFVDIMYYFSLHGSVNGSTNYSDTSVSESWYWTTSTFYLLQPIESLQFSSLLFADSHLRKESLILYLEPACYKKDDSNRDKMMQLLTQRLQLYAMKQNSIAAIDDKYNPKAESLATIKRLYSGKADVWFSDAATWYALIFQIFFPLFLCISIGWFFANILITKKKAENSLDLEASAGRQNPDGNQTYQIISPLTDESMCICSCTFVVYVIGLDIAAFARSAALTREDIFSWFPIKRNAMSEQLAILIIMLFEDFAVGICTMGFSLLKLYQYSRFDRFNCSFVLLGPILCIGIHSFHILVGFIHTPYHATSVLVLYSVAFFIYLFAMRATYQNLQVCISDTRQCKKNCIFASLIALSFILFAGISSVYFLLLVVPINLATEDGPSRINAINHTILALISAALTYQLFFKHTNKNNLSTASNNHDGHDNYPPSDSLNDTSSSNLLSTGHQNVLAPSSNIPHPLPPGDHDVSAPSSNIRHTLPPGDHDVPAHQNSDIQWKIPRAAAPSKPTSKQVTRAGTEITQPSKRKAEEAKSDKPSKNEHTDKLGGATSSHPNEQRLNLLTKVHKIGNRTPVTNAQELKVKLKTTQKTPTRQPQSNSLPKQTQASRPEKPPKPDHLKTPQETSKSPPRFSEAPKKSQESSV